MIGPIVPCVHVNSAARSLSALTSTSSFGIDSRRGGYVRERNMPDPKIFRENAERCLAMAADTSDPHLREGLVETAQRWLRLAIEIEADHSFLEPTHYEKAKVGR
jgi:hypothetical protein